MVSKSRYRRVESHEKGIEFFKKLKTGGLNQFEKKQQQYPARRNSGPAPLGGSIPGPWPPNDCLCPPNENCASPSDDCAPKKLTGLGLPECKLRPKTPKVVFTALEFVSKNCLSVIFVDLQRISFKFWGEDLFFLVFTSEFVENCKRRPPEFEEIFVLKIFLFFGLHLFRLIHT